MKHTILAIFFSVLFLSSCGEYQKLLKSTDPHLKYAKAIEYLNEKKFMQASTLFEDVKGYFKGTEASEDLLFYLAKSYMGQKDYYSASKYFETYEQSYPTGKYIFNVRFNIGYCYYLDSPDARLDQTATINAVSTFQKFIDLYSNDKSVSIIPENNVLLIDARKYIDELQNKLAYKYLLNAKNYYKWGNYLGNNYESAIITAQNAISKYPNTSYKEDLSFIILNAKYDQATQSIEEKKMDRYRATIDEYFSFINEFGTGKYRKQADKIFNESKKIVKD